MGTRTEGRHESLHPLLLALLAAWPEEPEQFRHAIDPFVTNADVDRWKQFLSFAGHHGVLGVIDAGLAAKGQLPEGLREPAVTRLAIEELWNAHVLRGLEAAVAILADARVDVCALKGPLLGARLYPAPAARPCSDVDLLVHPDDLERAVTAFTNAGYVTGPQSTTRYLRKYGHHFEFRRRGMPTVELHFHAYAGFGVVLPASAVMARAGTFRVGAAGRVLIPAPEDEFIYLAVHAAGHSFIRLVWLYDLKLLVRRYPTIDWNQVARRSEALGVMTAVAYATRLLHTWLGVTGDRLPESSFHRSARSRMADWLLPEVSKPQPRSLRDNLGGLLFTSLLCDEVTSSAWLLQHHVLRTTRRRLKRLAPAYLPDQWVG